MSPNLDSVACFRATANLYMWILERTITLITSSCGEDNLIDRSPFWVLVVNVGPPTFVSFLSHFCPNVPILSRYCPDLVSFLSPSCPLSHFWLFSVYFVLNFVPILSSFCHCWFSIVPILSSFEPLLYGKSSGQILVITRTELFSHFLPGHPAAGQNVDNIWTTACPIFVAFLSSQLI